MTLTLFMLVGPCGSGKTVYANQLVKDTPDTVLISPDNLREELSGDMNDQSRNAFIFNKLVPIRMNGAHIQRKNIVYDATCYNRKNRKGIIEHAKGLGYQIEAHVFRTPIEVCKARNTVRTRVVPDFVIDNQFAKWQEPELSEGIDRIVEVGP